MQDPAFLRSRVMHPILHPLKIPSKLTNVSDEVIHKHPEFTPNLPALYWTPTTCKIENSQDRSTDHYITYASRNMTQLQLWQGQKLNYFCLRYNFLKPTSADLGTYPNDTTPPAVKCIPHQTYQTLFERKTLHFFSKQQTHFSIYITWPLPSSPSCYCRLT